MKLLLDIDDTLTITLPRFFMELGWRAGICPHEVSFENINETQRARVKVMFSSPQGRAILDTVRVTPEVYEDLEPMPGAMNFVKRIQEELPVQFTEYLTFRPKSVEGVTRAWLTRLGFPNLPMTMAGENTPYEARHKWKKNFLYKRWPEIGGIVEDDRGLPGTLNGYKGKVILLGVETHESGCAVPCPTWENVYDYLRTETAQ